MNMILFEAAVDLIAGECAENIGNVAIASFLMLTAVNVPYNQSYRAFSF